MKMRARMSPPLSETPSPLLWLDCPTCQLCLCPRPPRTMLWTALPLSTEMARGLVSSPPTQRGCPLVRGALCTAWRPLYKRSVCFWPQEFLWKMRNKKTFESWRNRREAAEGSAVALNPHLCSLTHRKFIYWCLAEEFLWRDPILVLMCK